MMNERKREYRRAEHERRMMKERTAKFKTRSVDYTLNVDADEALAFYQVTKKFVHHESTGRTFEEEAEEKAERMLELVVKEIGKINDSGEFPFIMSVTRTGTAKASVMSFNEFVISFHDRAEATRKGRTRFPTVKLSSQAFRIWHTMDESFATEAANDAAMRHGRAARDFMREKQRKHFKKKHNGRGKRRLDL